MNRKDINYRQGRSKKQVETNEKVAFMAFGSMIIAFTILMFGLLIEKLIG